MSDPATFIESLRRLGQRDLGKVAILRRSLSSEPGEDVRAFPMVEPHLPSEWDWARKMYYLVAGLWASVNTASILAAAADGTGEPEQQPTGDATPGEPQALTLTERGRQERRSFGHAVAQLYRQRNGTESIEQRFIALLDADETQLAHHLRQMVQLLKGEEGIRIYWAELLRDLLAWNGDDRRVQQRWARAFYRTAAPEQGDGAMDTGTQATTEGAVSK